jgi:prevent-host-death family protein
MQTLTSRDVQTRFGAVLDLAKREPITVTQYGRPSVMIVPLSIGEEAVRQHNASRFAEFLDVMPAPNPQAPTLNLKEVNQLVHETRP